MCDRCEALNREVESLRQALFHTEQLWREEKRKAEGETEPVPPFLD